MKNYVRCILLTTTCFFIILSVHSQINNFDFRILRHAAADRTPKQNTFFKFISAYNNPVCLSGPAALFITGLAKNDDLLKRKALFGVESIASAEFITFSIKYTINRPRPYKYDTTFLAVKPAAHPAFPSGHTSEAFAMATAMSIACPKWYVIVPAYTWASMIAYARVYLGVHYPTDVITGAIIGSGSTYLMYKLNKSVQGKGNHPGNEITGTLVGLGSAYLLYKVNHWMQRGKKK